MIHNPIFHAAFTTIYSTTPPPSPPSFTPSSPSSSSSVFHRRFPAPPPSQTHKALLQTELSSIHKFYESDTLLDPPGRLKRGSKVLVVGAGSTGLHAAYFLSRAGYQVTVIEKENEPCQGGTALTTGLVNVSGAEPLIANLRLFNFLLSTFLPGRAPPHPDFQFAFEQHTKLATTLTVNAATFCTRENTMQRMRALYGLGLYSRWLMGEVARDLSVDYREGQNKLTGLTRLYKNQNVFNDHVLPGLRNSRVINNADYEVIVANEFRSLAPALEALDTANLSMVHSSFDVAYEPSAYLSALTKRLASPQHNVKFMYGTTMKKFAYAANGDLLGVVTDKGTITADKYILAPGVEALTLLPTVSKFAHSVLVPFKTYGLQFRLPEPLAASPPFSLTLPDSLTTIVSFNTPAGRVVRVTQANDVATRVDTAVPPERVDKMVEEIQYVWPTLTRQQILTPITTTASANSSSAPSAPASNIISRLRLLTADGLPIIGPVQTRVPNGRERYSPHPDIYLATGSGGLDWTLSCASGKLLADLLMGRPSLINADKFDMRRVAREWLG